MSTHCKHVKEVLKYPYKAGLYIKVKKCKFHSKLIKYLKYNFSSFRLTMSDNKIKTIQNWLELKKVKNIQFFIDFANFYH